MIDWSGLVLNAAMGVFSQKITVTPVKSQPGAAAYSARGVFSYKVVQIALEGMDGAYESTNQPTLGIRLADFPAAPKQEDVIVMAQGKFRVRDIQLDGQGGADLTLQRVQA